MSQGPNEKVVVGDDTQYRPVKQIDATAFAIDGGLVPYRASHPFLLSPDQPVLEDIERIIFVIAGMWMNSDEYVANAVDIIGPEEARRTLVVGPELLRIVDRVVPGFLPLHHHWEVDANGWKFGYPSLGPAPTSTFAVLNGMIEAVATLVRLGKLPNLTHIEVAGNSAGYQFLTLYILFGIAQEVVARLNAEAGRDVHLSFFGSNGSNSPHLTKWRAGKIDEDVRGRFNWYPYGLEYPAPHVHARFNEIAAQLDAGAPCVPLSNAELLESAELLGAILVGPTPSNPAAARELGGRVLMHLVDRLLTCDTTLLFGSKDNKPTLGSRLNGEATAQGPKHLWRLGRGQGYEEHAARLARSCGYGPPERLPFRVHYDDAGHFANDLWRTPKGMTALLNRDRPAPFRRQERDQAARLRR